MSIGIHVITEKEGSITILRLEGRLDATSSPILDQNLKKIVEEGGKKILLDFAKVGYLSSAGMRVLLASTKKLKVLKGKLNLCDISEGVLEIIKMAGFEKILNIYFTEEEAFDAFSPD
ncbi:MAG: STAS domain-containing protein [Simkania negevensis]|nr:STAS domain-containing protein [Simkania negevensis]